MSEKMPTLICKFAAYQSPTLIRDAWFGDFYEIVDGPGVFRKSVAERGDKIRINWQHGKDFSVGAKSLGSPTKWRIDEPDGARVEVALDDTSFVRDLLPGLRRGAYGSSFAFQIERQDIDQFDQSPWNIERLPVHRLKSVRLIECGPVATPAYEATGNAVRSSSESPVQRMKLLEDDEPRKFTDRSWLRWLDRRLEAA